MDTPIKMTGWSPAMSLVSKIKPSTTFDLTFTNLNHIVGKGDKAKQILKEISGTFKSGQLIGILGASGAGKTSLMNILAGLKTSSGIDGDIKINGIERDLKSFRRQSSYIMQKDHLLPNLTVDEYMTAAADLKLGDQVSREEKETTIQLILQTLGLADTRRTRISCLSGGECKRFSIGLELIGNPAVLFLDEPTSGLDSSSSLQLVTLLHQLARSGRTVVLTIHQPSSRLLEYFDLVYFVANGMCMYQGPVQSLISFFRTVNLSCPNHHNPADYAIDVACGVYGNVVSKLVSKIQNGQLTYLQTPCPVMPTVQTNGNNSKADPVNDDIPILIHNSKNDMNDEAIERFVYPASFFSQFTVLLKRTLQTIWRDRVLMLLRFSFHVFVAIMIGILYWQVGNEASMVMNNAGYLFFNHLFILYAAMMPSALTFSLERKVLVREHLNHWYSLKAYYMAKTTADIPFQVLFPTVYIGISYLLSNQPMTLDRFVMLTVTSILLALVGQGIGLIFGAAFSIPVATYFAPTSSIPFLILCGFFISTSMLPAYLRWMLYPSFFHHAFEASMVAVYGYDRDPLSCSDDYCYFRYPEKLLELFAISPSAYVWSTLGLIILFFVTRLAGYFVLGFKIRHIR